MDWRDRIIVNPDVLLGKPVIKGIVDLWWGGATWRYSFQPGRIETLLCPASKSLYVKNRNFITPNGYKAIAYQAPKTACRDCRLRFGCLRNPDTISRQVHIIYGKRRGSITDEMKQKIDTLEWRHIYSKRLGHSRTGLRQYSLMQKNGSVHVAGAYQGQHPMDALLPGSQYWKDHELWKDLCCFNGIMGRKTGEFVYEIFNSVVRCKFFMRIILICK